ncbi:pentatricopeptide repeat-containing protein At1g09410, mitochondrial-like [Selaginella moellendorffii]|uniref:pentatricopeptide repeat-containing protein At1g09410, mitochondrial-like n=1 Tax=Selaginella moellendorffii TaxID=88036 RepID=UPI000D1C7E24|nr:pentatricopeptide repeat-containing protein At1g09410, mitochondrial-like [Selaginella moellendorffii]|eukprot:XP_024516973.1 pentatricopeptide repeat-containing protein At1g09410, mitochondrial-like [Selaginella moellendorffii]
MYVKCRSMVRAQEVFDRMKSRDVVSWNVLMLGYAQDGENEELALEMFMNMVSSRGCQLDSWSVVAALQASEPRKKLGIHRRSSDGLQLFGDLLHSQSLVAALKASTQEQGRQVDGKIVTLRSREAGMAVHSLSFRPIATLLSENELPDQDGQNLAGTNFSWGANWGKRGKLSNQTSKKAGKYLREIVEQCSTLNRIH